MDRFEPLAPAMKSRSLYANDLHDRDSDMSGLLVEVECTVIALMNDSDATEIASPH